MERKAKVTQEAVNAVCNQLKADDKTIGVNAVIAAIGGSFSTVGPMVKRWKEEQASQSAPLPEMPESVTQAMHRATADLWATASTLAGETIERVQQEADETVNTARGELQECMSEVSRLEGALEQAQQQVAEMQQRLDDALNQLSNLTTQNTALETRLSDREEELKRLRVSTEKLQAELIEIAKHQTSIEKGKTGKK